MGDYYQNRDSFKGRRSTRSRTNTLIHTLSRDSASGHQSDIRQRSGRKRSITHFVPEVVYYSKYLKVWKRVRVKLRVLFVFNELRKDMHRYGISTINLYVQRDNSENDSQEFFRRAHKLMTNGCNSELADPMPRYIIHPASQFKTYWNWVLAFILIYSAIVTPFTVSFFEEGDYIALDWFDILINILFFLDFCVNCFSAYYNKNKILVKELKEILKNYAKKWMLIDFLTWFPFEFFINSSNSQTHGKMTRILQLPKLYRLFRLSKLLKLLQTRVHKEILDKLQEFFSMKNSAVKVAKSYMTIAICVHIVACLWYLAAKLYDFGPKTWVFRNNYQDSDIGTLYLTSLYWALATFSTVGYGDIVPNTITEIIITIFWMSFGLYFFSFNISRLTSLVSSLDLKENALANKLAMIEEFSTEANLPKSTRSKVKECFKYSAEKRGFSWLEKMNIINELPKLLRYEVALAMHHGAAKQLNFFKGQKETFITVIVPMLEPVYMEEEVAVYEAEAVADEIYYLTKGVVTIEYGRKLIVETIPRNGHFGDIEVCFKSKRIFAAFTSSFCEMLVMGRQVIEYIQKEYPHMWRHIYVMAAQREKQFMRTVVIFEETEKCNKGDIEFSDFDSEFDGHVEKVLNERMSFVRRSHREVNLGDLMKRIEDLISLTGK